MRVSEVYLSIQGEGPRVGAPTVFVRFGGCNLKCPGWPCDTPHAIDPAYRKEWLVQAPEEVYAQIKEVTGDRLVNVCFTGGEPFLQRAVEIDELLDRLSQDGHVDKIECFSNGTLPYTYKSHALVNFVMDWKLPGSGESMINTQRVDNFKLFIDADVVKFTIADRNDYNHAVAAYLMLSKRNNRPQYYYGAVWGKQDNAELVGWVLEDNLPWKFNMQIHNIIWDRTQRGI